MGRGRSQDNYGINIALIKPTTSTYIAVHQFWQCVPTGTVSVLQFANGGLVCLFARPIPGLYSPILSRRGT